MKTGARMEIMPCKGKVSLHEQKKLQDVFPAHSRGVFSLSLKRFSSTNLAHIVPIPLLKMFLYMRKSIQEWTK